MRLQQIRNATVIVESVGTRLLVDPWLENKGAGFTATCPWPERNVPSPLVNLPCFVDEVLENICEQLYGRQRVTDSRLHSSSQQA